MLPNQLAPESFAAYPPEARRLAVAQVGLLRRLPLAFVPLLLRELIVYDWKFPAERRDLDRQFAYLGALSPSQLAKAMAAFAQLHLAPELEKADWVNSPGTFTEQWTAHLWTTHQIDGFRAAAVDYVAKSSAPAADDALPTHRLGIAVIGQGVQENRYRLFRKLRQQGTYYPRLKPSGGLKELVAAVERRAAAHPSPYAHWYIDGGVSASGVSSNVVSVSYAALASARGTLQSRMQKIYESSVFDPEAFRTRMAQTQPAEIGLNSGDDAVLNRFQLSLLTEGSGTQVFATTFVQWAAREALRRAQPLTLLVRFAPRQRENPMNELLAEARRRPELDPQGSLVDADMGAYYTWLNQQRLPGAEKAFFLAWFEDQQEAVVVGPRVERGKTSETSLGIRELIAQMV
jgi:hypothetical protein